MEQKILTQYTRASGWFSKADDDNSTTVIICKEYRLFYLFIIKVIFFFGISQEILLGSVQNTLTLSASTDVYRQIYVD